MRSGGFLPFLLVREVTTSFMLRVAGVIGIRLLMRFDRQVAGASVALPPWGSSGLESLGWERGRIARAIDTGDSTPRSRSLVGYPVSFTNNYDIVNC